MCEYCGCSPEGCSCGCSCGTHHHQHHHKHHGHWSDMEAPVSLMDVDEEVKMLEEYRDALNERLEKVNKRLSALKR